MRRPFRQFLTASLITVVLTSGLCAAQGTRFDPPGSRRGRCVIDHLWGNIEIVGEYLFIRPHTCDLDYVIVDNRPAVAVAGEVADIDRWLPSGKERGICPDYQSAFRVGAGFLFNGGCSDIAVTYTRLETKDKAHVRPAPYGGLWMTDGHPRYERMRLNNRGVIPVTVPLTGTPLNALASMKVKVHYNMVDGQLGLRTMPRCDLWLRGFAGIRWAEFRVRRAEYYQGTTTEFLLGGRLYNATWITNLDRAKAWGVGPRLGGEIRYDLCRGFGLACRFGGAILVGEDRHCTQYHIDSTTVAASSSTTDNIRETMHIRHHSHCVLFPEFDARMGITYLRNCQYFVVVVEAGWEFVTYINAIGRLRFDDYAGTSHEVCESFGLDGLYVTFRIVI